MPSDRVNVPSEAKSGMGPVGRRWLLLIGAVVTLLGALVGAERFLTVSRQATQPTEGASFIWMRGANRFAGPSAFYAVRDFELAEVPASATLSVLGDEEYVLYLNGERVGSNRYVSGAGLDRFRVESLLEVGTNRITVHLRSSRSEGAFLAVLRSSGRTTPVLVTDGDWRIVRRRLPKLTDTEIPLDPPSGARGRGALVVASPPTGRWGRLESGAERPLHADLVRQRSGVSASRILLPGGGWRRRYPRVRYTRPMGEHVTFDWGRVRTGYLVLDFPRAERSVALVYLGQEPPDPLTRAPDSYVITTNNDSHWEDSVPRAFRYALVVGLDNVTDAHIVLTHASKLAPIPAGESVKGVFGLAAPRLRSAIEDEVWGKLERFASDSEGES